MLLNVVFLDLCHSATLSINLLLHAILAHRVAGPIYKIAVSIWRVAMNSWVHVLREYASLRRFTKLEEFLLLLLDWRCSGLRRIWHLRSIIVCLLDGVFQLLGLFSTILVIRLVLGDWTVTFSA